MSRDAFGHGMAVAMWAAVGAVVAVSVSPMLWWLGLAAGGAAGYPHTDFRDLRDGIRYAWRKAGQTTAESWKRAIWWTLIAGDYRRLANRFPGYVVVRITSPILFGACLLPFSGLSTRKRASCARWTPSLR